MAGTTHRVAPYGIEDKQNSVHVIGYHHKFITNACSIIAEPLHIIPSNSPFVRCDPVGRPISRTMHGMDYPYSARGCSMAGTTHRVAPYGIEDKQNSVHVIGHHHVFITNEHVPSSRPVAHSPVRFTIRTARPGGSPDCRPIRLRSTDSPCPDAIGRDCCRCIHESVPGLVHPE